MTDEGVVATVVTNLSIAGLDPTPPKLDREQMAHRHVKVLIHSQEVRYAKTLVGSRSLWSDLSFGGTGCTKRLF